MLIYLFVGFFFLDFPGEPGAVHKFRTLNQEKEEIKDNRLVETQSKKRLKSFVRH